jgi:hypothetical protein
LDRTDGTVRKVGIFSLKAKQDIVKVSLPDGTYVNYLDGNNISVTSGTIHCAGKPIVIAYSL